MVWERQLDCLSGEELHPRVLASLEGNNMELKEGLEGSKRGCGTQQGAGEKGQVSP